MFFRSPPWESLTYWSIDLETGGLDPVRDPVVAVGMVPIRAGRIHLGDAWATLVRPEDGKSLDPDSVRAHQLVWGEVKEAPPLAEVLPEIERRLGEGVMLVHQKTIELGFLTRACRRVGRTWPKPPVVDTVDLLIKAARRRRRVNPDLPDDLPPLNLSLARKGWGLPAYQAHDALTDAVATAELFLVLRSALVARTLRDLR